VSGELQPLIIDLNAHRAGLLTESWLKMFGGAVKYLLQGMFGKSPLEEAVPTPGEPQALIRGTADQVAAFGTALGEEKKYMETFLEFGLNAPESFKAKASLNQAVEAFEAETGIKWPFN
jgi:hypothetical protein